MISFDEFKFRVAELDKKIIEYYAGKGESVNVEGEEPYQKLILSDGIVDVREYYQSPVKIMWILKEPYDMVDNGRYTWSLSEYLGSEKFFNEFKDRKSRTFYPIIYATYGILNNIASYEDMYDIDQLPEMIRILKKISFINLQKFPAKSTSKNQEIKKAYETHKVIIQEQIKLYNPDIVIGGNTLYHLVDDLELKDHYHCNQSLDHWIKDNRLYIHSPHPSAWTIDTEEFVDDILDVVNDFKKSNSFVKN